MNAPNTTPHTTSGTKPYLITPLAPLVMGNGRPFGQGGVNGGQEPTPSVVAGALRAHWVDDASNSKDLETLIKEAQQQTAHGPFLLREDSQTTLQLYVPQPADSVYLRNAAQGGEAIHRLQPQALAGVDGNWPMFDKNKPLLPVQLQGDNKSKPVPGPRYWPLSALMQWRTNQTVEMIQLENAPGPQAETRTHVALDSSKRIAKDGQLFQTTGLNYGHIRLRDAPRDSNAVFSTQRWHLAARFGANLSEGLMTLGGERRPSWLSSNASVDHALAVPQIWPSTGAKDTHWLCLTLLTPALFDLGWMDKAWQGQDADPFGKVGDISVRLIAAALPRWQGISGWNLNGNHPKASRRMVPEGAVYWFELKGDIDADTLQKLWLAPISSSEQDRNDGFGLVIPAMVPIPSNTDHPPTPA